MNDEDLKQIEKEIQDWKNKPELDRVKEMYERLSLKFEVYFDALLAVVDLETYKKVNEKYNEWKILREKHSREEYDAIRNTNAK